MDTVVCVCVYVMNEESMCDKDWCLTDHCVNTTEFSNLRALDGHWVAFMCALFLENGHTAGEEIK